MKTLSYFILAGFVSLSIFGCSNPNKPADSVEVAERQNDSLFKNDVNKKFLNDADFLVSAFNTGMTEIEIGNITKKNGLDQAIKDMGNSAVMAYTKMNETIKALATQKNITLPNEVGKRSKKEIEELREKSGNIFDRGYTKMIIENRVKEVKRFESAEKQASDADVKGFASETLPMLKKQLDAAEELKLRIPYY